MATFPRDLSGNPVFRFYVFRKLNLGFGMTLERFPSDHPNWNHEWTLYVKCGPWMLAFQVGRS